MSMKMFEMTGYEDHVRHCHIEILLRMRIRETKYKHRKSVLLKMWRIYKPDAL